ncbi:aldo/keto reductase [Clostridium sp. LY3-2]|uniref:aldo/keto reductase n=1 Tax=Clostridium sp. LY3-2 TaxID=2942482 RepID=UPI00215329D3|nr:aldo/keto reductase [Clostridium sp. LY3-2]MCR6513338.1 aldo/keto reductase [Clostridium sp. LY3-2]
MKNIDLGKSSINASEIGLGCMRIAELSKDKAEVLIKTALENGINFFDHADIYAGGRSEELFSKAINMDSNIREKMIIQSKCGIIPGEMYDFSKDHILSSVDKSLKRLKTDYLDTFLLHRPDILVEPEEVAEAFSILKKSGKVKRFGVSNHTPYQIELLNKYLDEKLIVNQLQFGIMHTGMLDSGVNMNMKNEASLDRDGYVLDYCRLNDITIQAWSPYQYGFFEGVFLNNDKFKKLNEKIDEIAKKYNVSNTVIATAWILRHPAKIQTIVGTTNSDRLKDISNASNVVLTRKEWYEIYLAAGNELP